VTTRSLALGRARSTSARSPHSLRAAALEQRVLVLRVVEHTARPREKDALDYVRLQERDAELRAARELAEDL
jgi:hypothetical protein